ncbi:MAG: ferredoxin [Candidatus Competibacteraceae bacterium]|nr:ferredoxin [Candidatus Competibacteraceae bacterium]
MCKIIHFRNKCIGCGACHDLHPDLWRMSKKDGKATLVRAIEKKQTFILDYPTAHAQSFKELVACCPVRIIKVI